MIIIALDDEALSLEGLTLAIKSASPDSSVHSFQSAEKALAFARETRPDVIFLDIEMRGMSGLEAAAHLQKMHPQVNIIFTTGYQEYMSEAFRLHVSGYITKPITPAKVQTELEHLRFPAADSSRSRIVIKTFGDFQIFADDHPMTFGYAKARELLAYLVDQNGSLTTSGKILDVLWEDSEGTIRHSSYLRNVRSDLKNVLKEHDASDILIQRRGLLGINKTLVSCDYFDYMDGKLSADAFSGEYMSQYSWGEWRLAELNAKKEFLETH